MGIEQIVTKIIDEARDKAAEIRTDFDERADVLERKWAEECELRKKEHTASVAEAVRKERERMITTEKLESRKRLLAVRRGLVDEAFAKAHKAFLDLPDEKYRPLLARLIAGASEAGTETVILSKRDRKSLGKQVVTEANELLKEDGKEASLTLADEEGTFDAGAILCHERVEIRRTLDELLGEIRERVEGQVASILFKEEK